MFSWGEQCRQGFRLKDGTYVSNQSAREVSFLDLGFDITHLSAGLRVLSFVKRNGNAFIIGTNESQDGTRVRGKQSKHAQVNIKSTLLQWFSSNLSCVIYRVCGE